MNTNKRLTNLMSYKSVLPYASEIFGVYQPLLGWKGRRNINRFINKPKLIQNKMMDLNIVTKAIVNYKTTVPKEIFASRGTDPRRNLDLQKFPFIENLEIQPSKIIQNTENILIQYLKDHIKSEDQIANLNQELLKKGLDYASSKLYQQYKNDFIQSEQTSEKFYDQLNNNLILQSNQISQQAGELSIEIENKNFQHLSNLIFGNAALNTPFPQYLKNPFESFDPTKQLNQVGLSPIGIVHLFRQYFYELDTFLGTPVGHVWLSPGSSVEMIETTTRRTLVEQYSEFSMETSQRMETALTEKDELSEAVKSENESSIKFGANVSGKQKWVWGEAAQSASFDMNTTQKMARENTHTQMREQTTKLSSEIRKNYKTTFKSINEVTDLSSKRILLNNTTDKLINYEMRRKMRQVAVQVQDIGTYLCWQTFVDYPGNDLGLSTLVHIADKPNGQDIAPPEEIPPLEPYSQPEIIVINCVPPNNKKAREQFDGNALDETYVICRHNGLHLEEDNGSEYEIERFHQFRLTAARLGYKLAGVKFSANPDVSLDVRIDNNEPIIYVTLNTIRFKDALNISLQAESFWEVDRESDFYKALEDKRRAAEIKYDQEIREKAKAAYITNVRDRVKVANAVQPRKYEELREEERIVVYRQLIKDLGKDVVFNANGDEKNKNIKETNSDFHVFYELLNSIFDIDKMLYFVAPEWWRSKPITQINTGSETAKNSSNSLVASSFISVPNAIQNLKKSVFKQSSTTIPKGNFVTWGVPRPNNYLITEDQEYPAKLGSSLGWLLQLDGDNLRNAFLNSPWVKAVIPIRPGKEKEALNWLKHVEGMNGITDKDMYAGPEPEHQGKTLLKVLDDLAEKVTEKHKASLKPKSFPETDDHFEQGTDPENKQMIDDRNTVSSTPVDRVYEHGFYPLQGGFRVDVEKDFQIFDQWVEILPTDQVVPVEVEYDPKTGRQL